MEHNYFFLDLANGALPLLPRDNSATLTLLHTFVGLQRDIEALLDYIGETSGAGDHAAVAVHQIRSIVYASTPEFKVSAQAKG